MTDEMMSLRALLEKSSDAELLREMVGFAAQRLDGAGGEEPDRRRAWRAQLRSAQPAQRLPRSRLGDQSGHVRAAYPEAATSLPSEPRLDRIKPSFGSSSKHGGPVYFLVLT